MTEPERTDEGGGTTAGGTIRAAFDWSAVTTSTAVVETLAVALDREPTAVEPLLESVDTDALDALVRSNATGSTGRGPSVTFAHAGHVVTVRANGTVVVRPNEPRPD